MWRTSALPNTATDELRLRAASSPTCRSTSPLSDGSSAGESNRSAFAFGTSSAMVYDPWTVLTSWSPISATTSDPVAGNVSESSSDISPSRSRISTAESLSSPRSTSARMSRYRCRRSRSCACFSRLFLSSGIHHITASGGITLWPGPVPVRWGRQNSRDKSGMSRYRLSFPPWSPCRSLLSYSFVLVRHSLIG